MGSSKTTKTGDFVISNTNLKLKQEIINIAAHKGTTYTQLLRSEIIKLRDSFPENMRKPPKED